jgi:DNA-binding CsgD family transcriptional regulator
VAQERPTHGADDASCGVIIARLDGRVRLATPRARSWLWTYFEHEPTPGGQLPAVITRWLEQERVGHPAREWVAPKLVVPGEGRQLIVRLMMTLELIVLMLEERATTVRRLPSLTRREAEVIAWVAEGKTNAEIATILGIGPRTVQHHLERIYQKLGVENRTAAARMLLATSPPAETDDLEGRAG